MTEYLSKFVYTRSIRSKEAVEIAEYVMDYISIFGPPKVILSDQGLEFNNKIVDTLLTKYGIEHRVTSEYNPRTNGFTERTNQTMIQALRKLAELDMNNWDFYLPTAQLCYNSKVNSITNDSPFRQSYGVKMNTFEDWSSLPLKSDVDALVERSIQLNQLQNARQLAIATIKDKQVVQKATQDKQHVTVEESLEPGTKVYVKREGLLGKLEPRYEGLYIVIRMTSKGNYELQDCLDQEAKKTYPLHILKVVEDVERESEKNVELDRILDHRRAKKGFDYLVKWKDGSEDSWVHESDFNTVEIINEYKNMIKSQNVRGETKKDKSPRDEQERRGRGRPRKNVALNLLSIVFTLLMLFCIFEPLYAIKITSDFLFCDTNNRDRLVDVNAICKPQVKTDWEPAYLDKTQPVIVYSKLHNLVNGEGYQCRKNKITRMYTVSFLGEKHVDYRKEHVRLTAEDCWEMVRTGKFNGIQMICNGKSCFLEDEPIERYESWRTIILENFTCEFSSRIIEEEKIEDPIFAQKCKPKDLWCLLRDSTFVWDRSAIHDCPLKAIYGGTFKNVFDNVLIDVENHIAVQILEKVDMCGRSKLFLTAEGLIVQMAQAINATLEQYGEKVTTDMKEIQDLMLADFDYTQVTLMKTAVYIDKRVCHSILASLNILKKFDNEFLRIRDANDREVVFYTADHMIFSPDCIPIQDVEIVDQTENCYKDILVIIKIGNKTVNAFLNHDKLIRKASELVTCDEKVSYLNIDEKLVKRTGNKIIITDVSKNFKRASLKFVNTNISYANFHHRPEIIEGVDFIDVIDKYTEVKDFNGKFLVLPSNKVTSISIEEDRFVSIGNWIKDKSFKLIVILVIMTTVVILVVVMYFICVWQCNRFKISINRRGADNDRELPSNLTDMELLNLNRSTFLNSIEPKPKKSIMKRNK